MYSYEEITDVSRYNAAAAADGVLLNGWAVRGYPALDLSEEIPWQMESPESRSWNFHIHSLDMIDALLGGYSQSSKLTYLSPALRVALDWVRTHPRDATEVSPMAWYDMAVGLRAYRLGYLYQAAEHEGLLNEVERRLLWKSLDDHRAELSDDANIAFHSNHGYYQVAGQLALGRRFGDMSQPMATLYDQGCARLHQMINQQFTAEGVHREHSPDYHRMVLITLQGLIRAGLVEDKQFHDRAHAIEEALAWFITPSGSIANFGDSDSRTMIRSAAIARRRWTTAIMRAAVSDSDDRSARPQGMRLFRESGYVVVRHSNAARNEPSCDSYLAIAAAFHSRTHKHADDLSFLWHDRGEAILVDAGRYGYIGKTEPGSALWLDGYWYSDPMRVFMESTRAHNTIEIDGRNFVRRGAKPYGSAIARAGRFGSVYAIEGRCKHFDSLWHDRTLLFCPANWLIVLDVYTDNLKQPHHVRQWFHASPGHRVSALDGGYKIRLKGSGETVQVQPLIDEPTATEVIEGRLEGSIQGWWSGNANSAEPAPAFAFQQEGRTRGVFATLFTFSHDAEPDRRWSRSNATGRKARFRWRDSQGQHQIELERIDKLFVRYALT